MNVNAPFTHLLKVIDRIGQVLKFYSKYTYIVKKCVGRYL